MNPTMGRYIDQLTTEQRDRLITAREMNDGLEWWSGDCGCLVGTAEDLGNRDAAFEFHSGGHHGSDHYNSNVWSRVTAAFRYPQAVRRFGKPRIVRAVKLRAAQANGCSPEQIQTVLRETVPA